MSSGSSQASVSQWIAELKETEDQAAQKLYDRYIGRLVALARQKLGAVPRRIADEEDVAQVALTDFFTGVRQQRFPRLKDRHDLWQVLVMLTERRAADQMRRHFAQKRGMGGALGESVLNGPDSSSSDLRGIERVVGCEPTPEFAVMVAEDFRLRIEQLDDDSLRRIAVQKMSGMTNQEIAEQLDCTIRTVERRLRRIRETWCAT